MAQDFSRDALLGFLDYLADKGLMKKATASARKAASNRVLGILSEEEAQDIRDVDIDQLMSRFANLEGSKFSPESLNVYRGRVRNAIDDFLRYQENPFAFKTNVASTARKNGAQNKKKGDERSPHKEIPEPHSPVRQPIHTQDAVASAIMPIPLRSDLTVRIHGLPFDLTQAEARKIANVIMALAVPD